MDQHISDTPAAVSSRPFDVPIFRAIWIATLASNFGSLIQSVGASWMMISITHSPTMVALVQSSTTLPIMLLSLWAGAIADNLDRRLVMIAAQIFMLLVSIGLALCAWLGLLNPWLLLAFTFLIGCGTALNAPAWQASVGDMVPRVALPGAVSLNSMGVNLARSTGPAIGGAIVAAAGVAAAFVVNAVSYLGLLVVLARWRPDMPPRILPRETLGAAMGAGVRYVAMSPHIRTVLIRAGLYGFTATAITALLPFVARDLITGGPLTYGLLLGAFGLGAVGGAFSSGYMRNRFGNEILVRGATIALGLGAAVTAISHILFVTIVALLIAGAGWLLALSTFNVSVQMAAPRWVVARAMALYQMFAFGGMAIGSWVFGELAASRGVSQTLLIAAALQVASVLVGLLRPLAVVEDLNLDPLSQWSEPDTAVPVEPRSGPIVVTIEYKVAESRILEFLTIMSERRRIRVRDGARHWTLLRDLGDPELWMERYHVATWLDYIRHNQRRTHADADNAARLHAMLIEPARVHRMIERQTGSLPFTRTMDAREMAAPVSDPTGSR